MFNAGIVCELVESCIANNDSKVEGYIKSYRTISHSYIDYNKDKPFSENEKNKEKILKIIPLIDDDIEELYSCYKAKDFDMVKYWLEQIQTIYKNLGDNRSVKMIQKRLDENF